MKSRIFALALGAMVCVGGGAYAQSDDQTQVIAQQGDWTAASYTPTPTDPPSVCIAGSASTTSGLGMGLRVDNQGDIDIRASNSSWSLPANASGNITVAVNGHTYSYPATAVSSTMIDASVTEAQLTSLVGDMETASTLQLKVGSSAPTAIPLDGSQVVLTAFMTCSGIQNPSQNTGGVNPFSSSSPN